MEKQVCVVGAGRWGMNHIRTLAGLRCLGGIVESRKEVRDKLAVEYPEVNIFENVDQAINEQFDGFTVATPAETHFEIAAKIIKAKNHVLVEKPLTLNSVDAIELNRLAGENNINLMVGHVLLFHPAFQKIKSMLDQGTLGKLQYLYSNRLNLGKIRTEENVFWSLAPHDISIFQYFVNRDFRKITSRGMDILQDGIHDTTLTSIEYENNVMGHIFVSWLHPFKEHRFIVVGSRGMISFEDSANGKPLIYYDKSVSWDNGVPKPKDGPTRHVEYENKMPLTEELKYFVKHLDGKPLSIANGNSAVEVINILEESSRSLSNGN